MLKFPTKNLFVEGPDCSGKTTLVKNIHRLTGYKWHIHDRSQISRSIFAKMYHRDLPYLDSDLHLEVSDLNNRFIFMLPDFSIIKERFDKRGDEIHSTHEDMNRVYSAFLEKYGEFRGMPNVIPCLDVATEKQCRALISSLDILESPSLDMVSDQVKRFVDFSGGESYPLQFTLYDNGEFREASPDSMSYEKEAEYYEKIYRNLHLKIDNELRGKNEYSRTEDYMSRRFVYSDNSCISFIQLSIRNRVMDFNTVIRSSDVENIFPHDLRFLYYLASTCYNIFDSEIDQVRLRFNLNSAHIIT